MAGLLSKVESDSLRSCNRDRFAGSNPAPAANIPSLRSILVFLYQGPLSVLAIAEHAGCLPPVRLATVDSILPLLDVGDHAHPEQQLAVVVRVVPLVPVKEIPRKVKPATPDLSQHDWKHGRVVDVAGRGERRQHDLQAQDGRYVVFPVGLLACLDEVALLPAWPLEITSASFKALYEL